MNKETRRRKREKKPRRILAGCAHCQLAGALGCELQSTQNVAGLVSVFLRELEREGLCAADAAAAGRLRRWLWGEMESPGNVREWDFRRSVPGSLV
jgi:hypothetical protein